MINFKTLTMKNFLSTGNIVQTIDLDRKDLVLVTGQNIDLSVDDIGAKNGIGKSTIINALSYALYGQPIAQIKLPNLINHTNAKNMMVTLEFTVDQKSYIIERGRSPNIFKLTVDSNEFTVDESQGDGKETQQAFIEQCLGLTYDLFKHIVVLNTYVEPFLTTKVSGQRVIIEQLLGMTLLSEKADILRDQVKYTKEEINSENIRIKAVTEANERINQQIESLIKRKTLWNAKQQDDICKLEETINGLHNIDISIEIENHELNKIWQEKRSSLVVMQGKLANLDTQISREKSQIKKLEYDLEKLLDHKCHACGQHIHDEKHAEIIEQKTNNSNEAKVHLGTLETQFNNTKIEIESIGDLGTTVQTLYNSISEALDHKATLDALTNTLEQKKLDVDPYHEQIEEMKTKALQEISWELVDELTVLKEHQEFLLKLMTSKDSFIRKSIINQNLSYLNLRLCHYLKAIGMAHEVKFLNDLSVEITNAGRDLDFENLSRGERNRVILGLSWAFRDLWESSFKPINLMFLDEILDNGTDSAGTEYALTILRGFVRDRNKSVFLVSHKDELLNRVNNVLTVTKEGGFSTYF